jgi:hypothetical protein
MYDKLSIPTFRDDLPAEPDSILAQILHVHRPHLTHARAADDCQC